MVCAYCRVFEGEPICGACRALKRIQAALVSGSLQGSQEARVVGVLRSAAGQIQDLVEENLSPAPLPEGRPPTSKEATKGLTSGPFEGAGDVKKEDASGSDYGEGDEEEIKATKGAGEAEEYEEESAEEESEEPSTDKAKAAKKEEEPRKKVEKRKGASRKT